MPARVRIPLEKKGARSRMGRQYLCIDLKSFYASVECVERGLDPMTADLAGIDYAGPARDYLREGGMTDE